MQEIRGDFWKHHKDYSAICVTTNSVVKWRKGYYELVMGAGIAKQFADRYPEIPRFLGFHVRAHGNTPKVTRFTEGPAVVSFPTKENWRDPSPIDLITKSAKMIVRLADMHHFDSVLSVQPGCGLGGLRWSDIKPVLEEAGWDDRFTIISPSRWS